MSAVRSADAEAIQRRRTMALLFVVTMLSFVDRTVFIALGQPIKQDLGLSDFELGLLGGFAFAVFYTLAGLPIARLAEHASRVQIVAFSVALWSLMTAGSAAATHVWQLMLARVGGSIGEAGVQPAAISLVTDHHPPLQRGAAVTLISLGMPAGLIIGSIGGGWMAETLSWRSAFLVVGAPGVVVTALVLLLLREPARGRLDAAGVRPDETPSLRQVLALLWRCRSWRWFVAALALTSIAAQGIGTFLFPYFVRSLHLSFAEAGLMFGTVGGIAMAFGMAFGGYGVDWIGRRDARWFAWLPALGLAVATPLYLLAFSSTQAWLSVTAVTFGGVFVFMHFGPTMAVFQNMVGPRMRATAAFLFFLVTNLVGMGLGPPLVGHLSDVLSRVAWGRDGYEEACRGVAAALPQGCDLAQAQGLAQALGVCACVLGLGLVAYLMAGRSVQHDLGGHLAAPNTVEPGETTRVA